MSNSPVDLQEPRAGHRDGVQERSERFPEVELHGLEWEDETGVQELPRPGHVPRS